ncbi:MULTISPECIES: glycosyltransferase family protein [Bacillus cereus group]|uniref:Glycosyltransferase n=1 Tax=Bacillus proteolyticus TaxID=2026192 RepID=A0ABV3IIX6_9BACI|nr:glycosyltransferase [Bacillus cereus group sp. N8]MBJ8107815.1 glycosyltransferase [Bacillus cereus group sp. N8]
MRILFLESSHIWKNNLPRGFQANGHDVLISGPLTKNLSQMLEEFNPDLVISIGWGQEQTKIKQDLIRECMKKTTIPLIYWAVEDPAYTDIWSIPLVKRMKPDFVFTICPKTVKVYRKLGVPAAHLDFGFEETAHYKSPKSSEFNCSIAVVANAYPHILEKYPDHFRSHALNVLIRPLLEKNIRIDFWGNKWDEMNRFFGMDIPKDWIHGPMHYLETYKVYNSADIIIGLQNYQELITQRTYEILGSGGFLLTLDTPGVKKIFRPGKDLITVSSSKETLEAIHYFLNHPKKKVKIQERGRTTVQGHTYQARAKQIIDTLIEHNILIEREKTSKQTGEMLYVTDLEEDYEMYTIEKGDTLNGISKKFGVSIESLKKLNNLTSNIIVENERLAIRKKNIE